jgi:hypothetical protein
MCPNSLEPCERKTTSKCMYVCVWCVCVYQRTICRISLLPPCESWRSKSGHLTRKCSLSHLTGSKNSLSTKPFCWHFSWSSGWGFCWWHAWFKKSKVRSRAWWHTPLIPSLGRQRRADFWVRGQPGLQNEFQDSQGYTEKPCLGKKKVIRVTCFAHYWAEEINKLIMCSVSKYRRKGSVCLHGSDRTGVPRLWGMCREGRGPLSQSGRWKRLATVASWLYPKPCLLKAWCPAHNAIGGSGASRKWSIVKRKLCYQRHAPEDITRTLGPSCVSLCLFGYHEVNRLCVLSARGSKQQGQVKTVF